MTTFYQGSQSFSGPIGQLISDWPVGPANDLCVQGLLAGPIGPAK